MPGRRQFYRNSARKLPQVPPSNVSRRPAGHIRPKAAAVAARPRGPGRCRPAARRTRLEAQATVGEAPVKDQAMRPAGQPGGLERRQLANALGEQQRDATAAMLTARGNASRCVVVAPRPRADHRAAGDRDPRPVRRDSAAPCVPAMFSVLTAAFCQAQATPAWLFSGAIMPGPSSPSPAAGARPASPAASRRNHPASRCRFWPATGD